MAGAVIEDNAALTKNDCGDIALPKNDKGLPECTENRNGSYIARCILPTNRADIMSAYVRECEPQFAAACQIVRTKINGLREDTRTNFVNHKVELADIAKSLRLSDEFCVLVGVNPWKPIPSEAVTIPIINRK